MDRLLLKDLIEKGSDNDLLREMMTFVANRMMDLDIESLTGAALANAGSPFTSGLQRRTVSEEAIAKLKGALEAAGVEFFNGASQGVRLR